MVDVISRWKCEHTSIGKKTGYRDTEEQEMARFDINSVDQAALGSDASADIIFEMGMAAASGRDRDMNLIEAHKWFNIAAI